MDRLNNNQRKFLALVIKARNLDFDLDKIKKKDKVKQEEKRKILKVAHMQINDNECLEVLLILIKRNVFIKTVLFFLIKYFIKSFSSSGSSSDDNDDLF